MNLFAIYDKSSGRILRGHIGNQESADEQCAGDTAACSADGADLNSSFVSLSTGQLNQREKTPCTPNLTTIPADGATPLKLSQMRPETHISVSGPVSGDMTCSGTDTITFAEPGRYVITATAPWPALPKEIVVDAT